MMYLFSTAAKSALAHQSRLIHVLLVIVADRARNLLRLAGDRRKHARKDAERVHQHEECPSDPSTIQS